MAVAIILSAVLLTPCAWPAGIQGDNTNTPSTNTTDDTGDLEASDAQRLKELEQLIRDGRYTSAERFARVWLSALGPESNGTSRVAKDVSDRLLEILLRSEKGGDAGGTAAGGTGAAPRADTVRTDQLAGCVEHGDIRARVYIPSGVASR